MVSITKPRLSLEISCLLVEDLQADPGDQTEIFFKNQG